jgi:tryptophanyl-tRNA synthetase
MTAGVLFFGKAFAQQNCAACRAERTMEHPTQLPVKRIFSGIQPTGELHLGNYFGAVANWARLQHDHTCVYCVVDLHAMTMPYEPAQLKKNTEDMFISLLAAGLDPAKCIVFVQSMVPEHSELAWIFNCVASYGDLTRQAQFKDKSEQLGGSLDDPTSGAFISSGLFTYPVLQAADILLYLAGYVPVGKDQDQHLELSRSIARRFNNQFKTDFFPEPQVLASEMPKLLSLADPNKKMSKSLGEKHTIGLFAEEPIVRARVRSAVTDTGEALPDGALSPGVENLLGLLRITGHSEIAGVFVQEFAGGNRKYAPLKDAVGDALVKLTSDMRTRRTEVAADREAIRKLMYQTSQQAREIAVQTLKDVRRIVGLPKR